MTVERERTGASLVLLVFPIMHAGMCAASAARLDQRWLSYTALSVLAWAQWVVLISGVALWGWSGLQRTVLRLWQSASSPMLRAALVIGAVALGGHAVHAVLRRVHYVVAVPSYVGVLMNDLTRPIGVVTYAVGLSAVCWQLPRVYRWLRIQDASTASPSNPDNHVGPFRFDGSLFIASVLWAMWAFALVRTARGL